MLVWLLAILAVGSGTAGVVIYRKRLSARRAMLAQDAEESLRECRGWRDDVATTVVQALADGRWISRDNVEALIDRRPSPSTSMRMLARIRGRGAEGRRLLDYLGTDLDQVAESTNRQILEEELVARKGFLETIESQPLTDEQAAAVITFDNRVQVVAAAGSGKTSVMVARAAYAIERGFVPAHRILLLAFNKAAAAELQDRIETRLRAVGINADGVRADTFHAFGLRVIGRAEARKKRLAPWLEGGQDVEMVERIVDELRDSSEDFRYKWDIYRLLFSGRPNTPDGGTPDGYDAATATRGYRTFNGEIVKSEGERLIADFLFAAGINYRYEEPYCHDVADAEHSQYRPDFYYPDVDVWHEQWALDRHGNPPDAFRGYAESMRWKQNLHRTHATKLIETTWASIVDRTGFQSLADDLKRHGLSIDWNPDRPAAGATPMKHKDLARLVRQFMAHVKSNSLTAEALAQRLKKAPKEVPRYRAGLFLELYWAIHVEWQKRLAEADAIDFEDMIVTAAGHLESGKVDMGYDLVLVDEFQDASQARARLVKALVDKPNRHLLAVGDDWQSINRFAGADLSVMTAFNDSFGPGPTLRLEKSFRSTQTIIDTAADFVVKNPRQFKKQVRSAQPEDGPAASLVLVRNPYERATALSALLDDLAGRVRDGGIRPRAGQRVSVDVLGRYNFDKDLMPRKTPAELDVSFRTAHSSKGLEADYVILPNVTAGKLGFPSEIADDPVMALAMPEPDEFEHAEERRLMYVALTRARRHVTLISVRGQESAFVVELLRDGRLIRSPLSTAGAVETCPRCRRGTLTMRERRRDSKQFYGCTNFPSCGYTRNVDDAPF